MMKTTPSQEGLQFARSFPDFFAVVSSHSKRKLEMKMMKMKRRIMNSLNMLKLKIQ